MKKLVSLLLALLLTGVLPVMAGASEDVITVYAQVPQTWTNPCLWAWNGKQDAFDAWPGGAMTDCGDGWYAIEVGSWINCLIVNGNGGSFQTSDLAVEQGRDVYVRVASVADVTITYEKPEAAEIPAAGGFTIEQPFSDEEEVAAYLTYCLNNSLPEFQFTCREALFERLSRDNFAGLNKLEIQNGISGADVQYSSSRGIIDFSAVQYGLQPWVECADEAEVRQALADISAQFAYKFVLFVDPDLCASLYQSNMLHAYGAQCGMVDMSARYDLSGGIIKVEGAQYAENFACAADEDEFMSALEFMAHKGADSFFIAMDPDFFNAVMKEPNALDHMIAASPIDSYSGTRDYGSYCLNFTDVTYSDVPRIVCDTEDDIVQAIRNMGAAGSDSFNLVLNEELYQTVYDGYFKRLQELEADAGMTSADMSYNLFTHVLYFTGAVIHTDVEKLDSFDAVNAYVGAQAAAGAGEITLFCTPELYDALMEGFNPYITVVSSSMVPLYDVAAQAGIFDYGISLSDITHIIAFKDVRYYPGTNIRRAAESGDDSSLTGREREAWNAAQALAADCAGQTQLDTARNIHDQLARMIVYTDDESTDEDDTAIGALLNGEANCDGYADAFYIVGTLAGLEVRYQHGDSYDIGFNPDFLNHITHMWNLIRIDGTWRLVDVTWDDSEDRLTHTWFNLGYDRAARMHIWNEPMTVALDPATDLSCRPANEYLVGDADEAAAAVDDAAGNGFAAFDIIYTDGHAAEGHTDLLNAISGKVSGPFSYSWNERMLMLSVYEVAF